MKTSNNIIIPLIFLLSIIGMLTGGCVEDLDQGCRMENAQSIDTFYDAEFLALNCGPKNLEGYGMSEVYEIKSQSDYIEYITCSSDLPEFNFEDFFILAGVYRHHQCAIFDSQSVVVCGDQLIYTVFLLEQDCHAVTPVPYMTAVSREFENKAIRFEAQFVN